MSIFIDTQYCRVELCLTLTCLISLCRERIHAFRFPRLPRLSRLFRNGYIRSLQQPNKPTLGIPLVGNAYMRSALSKQHTTERIYPFPTPSISKVVDAFKAAVTRTAKGKYLYADKIWQTSFYDHIIRNDTDYRNIWNYISGNPSKWTEDRFYNA